MSESTRLGLILVFTYSFGVFFIASSIWGRGRLRFGRVAIVPVAGALLLGLTLYLGFPGQSAAVLPDLFDSDAKIPATVFAVALAIAAAVFTLALLVPIGVFILERIGRRVALFAPALGWAPDVVLASFFVVATGLSVLVVSLLVVTTLPTALSVSQPFMGISLGGSQYEAVFLARYPLQGSPTALTFSENGDGYLALADGQIFRFGVPANLQGDLDLELVAEGLPFPRGLAILADNLFVSHLGPYPCNNLLVPMGVRCVPATGDVVDNLVVSRGEVVSYPIIQSGRLGERRSVLGDLPVVNWEHGVNGMVAGPDGWLYLSIGGIEAVSDEYMAFVQALKRPNVNLLGTIVRFRPDGSDLEIYAKGIRNIWGLAFDDRGRLYGADNDGNMPGTRNRRPDQVLQLKKGRNYGFPLDEERDDEPIWVLGNQSPVDVEWAGKAGLKPGLLVGTRDRLLYLPLTEEEGRVVVEKYVHDDSSLTIVKGLPAWATVIEADEQQRVWVGTFGGSTDTVNVRNALWVFEFSQN